MKNQSIRTEMLKCHDNCRVGIMNGNGKMFLVWSVSNEMHRACISTDDCAVSSPVFKSACESAKESLIH